jgi:hypothetical protein
LTTQRTTLGGAPALARETKDGALAIVIFLTGVCSFLGSSGFFIALWRTASSDAPGSLPGIPILFCIEATKCTVLSALAAWGGYRGATRAGFDEPVLRAVVRQDLGAAVGAFMRAVPGAIVVGIAAFFLETLLWNGISGESLVRTASVLTHDVSSPVARASIVFYGGFGMELWFRWGVTSPVAGAAMRRGATRARAFWTGSAAAAVAYGIFALPSSIGAPPITHSILRFGGAGFVSAVCTSVVYGLFLRRRGLTAVALAHGAATLLRVLVLPLLFER